jgi:hypothetical protein
MGVKPRQSDKAAQKAFLILQQRAALPASEGLSLAGRLRVAPGGHAGVELSRGEFDRLVMDCLAAFDPPPQRQQGQSPPAQPQQPRQGQSPPLAHAAAAAHAAASAATAAAASLEDFRIACALREQRASVAVLLCGTSGTGNVWEGPVAAIDWTDASTKVQPAVKIRAYNPVSGNVGMRFRVLHSWKLAKAPKVAA